jgi:transcriptional regulator with XRE-family HTH domain
VDFDKIKKLAKRRGFTLKELIAQIDMSEANYYKCVKRGSIETRHLEKIADVLVAPPTYFFDESSGNQKNILGNNNRVSVDSPNSHNKTNTGSHELEICKERVKALESENKLLREMIEMYKKGK